MLKHIWRFLSQPNSLWARVYQAKYLKNLSLWEVNEKLHQSWLWKQILRQRDTFKQAISCLVGNGSGILFWEDKWLNNKVLKDYVTHQIGIQQTVSHFTNHNSWNSQSLYRVLPEEIVKEILGFPLPTSDVQDKLAWDPDKSGLFTIKSTYNFLSLSKMRAM